MYYMYHSSTKSSGCGPWSCCGCGKWGRSSDEKGSDRQGLHIDVNVFCPSVDAKNGEGNCLHFITPGIPSWEKREFKMKWIIF